MSLSKEVFAMAQTPLSFSVSRFGFEFPIRLVSGIRETGPHPRGKPTCQIGRGGGWKFSSLGLEWFFLLDGPSGAGNATLHGTA
jgi:hypothetical protein